MDNTECDLLVVYYDRLQFIPPSERPPPTTTGDNQSEVFGFHCQQTDTHVYHIRVGIMLSIWTRLHDNTLLKELQFFTITSTKIFMIICQF